MIKSWFVTPNNARRFFYVHMSNNLQIPENVAEREYNAR